MRTRRHRPLPIPQHEFAYTREHFRLVGESALDGERLRREYNALQAAREANAKKQLALIP